MLTVKTKKYFASLSGLQREKILNSALLEIVKTKKIKSILDIGSGSRIWSHLFPGCTYKTFDLDPNENPDIVGDFKSFEFKEHYDLIIATEFLEHFNDPELFYSKVNTLLNSNGYLLISTPFFFKIHSNPNDYFRFTLNGHQVYSDRNFDLIKFYEHGGYFQVMWEIFTSPKYLFFLRIFNRLFRIKKKSTEYPLGYVLLFGKKNG